VEIDRTSSLRRSTNRSLNGRKIGSCRLDHDDSTRKQVRKKSILYV
jgi:hypothetical protein